MPIRAVATTCRFIGALRGISCDGPRADVEPSDHGRASDQEEDEDRDFYFPVQKLFAGTVCIAGRSITLLFKEFHLNDKLKCVHIAGGVDVTERIPQHSSPFLRVRFTHGAGTLRVCAAQATAYWSSRDTAQSLLIPQGRRTLNRAHSTSCASKCRRRRAAIALSTSLQLDNDDLKWLPPEYVNIRHRVPHKFGALCAVKDMKSYPKKCFDDLLEAGNYEAAHFVDDTCDGALVAVVQVCRRGLTTCRPIRWSLRRTTSRCRTSLK